MKFERVLELYRDGQIARGDFLANLPNVSADTIDSTLGACPPEVLELLAERLSEYDPNAKRIELPPKHRAIDHGDEEIVLMQNWLKEHSIFAPNSKGR